MNRNGRRVTQPHVGRTAALAISLALVMAGCSPSSDAGKDATEANPSASASSSPLPSPSGTWTPPPTDAPVGPVTPAPVPTETAPIDEPVAFDTRVTVTLTSIEVISVEAQTPGENSGPAVRVNVSIENSSDEPIDVGSAVVNLSADEGEYGVGTTAGDPQPFQGSVEPGETAEGSYVFMLDPAADREVTITVNYAAGEPLAIFTGKTA